jgi:hypothetical protein
VSEDYTRKKMRCTQCGVIFDLPDPKDRSAIPAPPPPRTERPTAPAKTQPAKTASPPKSAPPSVLTGEPISSAPGTAVKALSSAPIVTPPPVEAPSDDAEDDEFAFFDGKDTRPYEKTGQEIRECPHCHATVNPNAKVCSACGFMLTELEDETGRPLRRRWESGWSHRRRLIFFLISQIVVLVLFIGSIVGGMNPFTFFFPYAFFTGMTAFLFGSYNWVDFARNKKGKLRLQQTWRICFFLRPAATLRLSDYEELASGVEGSPAINWIIVLFLILFGAFGGLVVGLLLGLGLYVVPVGVLFGVAWWVYARQKNTYYLSLCRDHGFPVVTLYRGWDQNKMDDMAETISKVARMPLRR